VPVPLHTLGGVKTSPLHVSGAQIVPTTYLRHPAAPSHLPSNPHVAGPVSTQRPCGSGTPDGTTLHWPALPGRLQLTQAPPQWAVQQTPSTQ
jgi:hypothetical protein